MNFVRPWAPILFQIVTVLSTTVACSNPLQNNTEITDKNSPLIIGVVNDDVPTRSKTWTWSCSLADAADCEYRFLVTTSPIHVFTNEVFSAVTTTTQNVGTGVYYLHLQVRSTVDSRLTSRIFSFTAVLDNTPPAIESVLASANGSYSAATPVVFTVNVSENVRVTGAPRIALTVGGSTRYANYASGSGTQTLIFSYTPQAGDTDTDGIALVAPTLDMNGGTITDVVAFALPASFTAPPVSGILVDTTAPVVTGLTNDPVPIGSKTWTWGCSEVCTYRFVIDNTPATTPTGGYSAVTTATRAGNGLFYIHVQARDLAGNESVVVHVSVTLNNAATPNPANWTWAMSSPASGSTSIDNTPQFSLSGASADNGTSVQLYDNSTCGNAVGSPVIIAGGTASITDVNYIAGGTQDGAKVYYAVATLGGNTSVCTTIGRNYFFDSRIPNAPGSPSNLTSWVTNLTNSPVFTWATPVDPGGAAASGIASVQVGISTAPAGGNNVVGWTTLGAGTVTHSYSGLSLTQCTLYYPSIRAVDIAGNISTVAVTAAFRADTTSPTAPVFTLGVDQNLTRTPTLTITTPGTDACSFQGYDLTISRDVDFDGVLDAGELSNILAWTNIGAVTTFQQTGLSLGAGSSYFVSLRSRDAAGNFSARVDSGVWSGQYCEGATNGIAYYSHITGATATLANMFVKTTVPGWANIDYAGVGLVSNMTMANTVIARPQDDNYALKMLGALEVKSPATYTFFTSSDDGSDLFVGNTRVVNNDGLHGVTEASGSIALAAGCYDLRVRFFENTGGDELTASWQSPAMARAVIPTTVLYPRYVPMPQIDWRLDTGAGATATDASMNGFNGSLVGTPAWNTSPTCTRSSARAITFDGVDDAITSPLLSGVDVLQTDIAASFWVRYTSASTSMRFLDLGNGATPGLQIRAGTTPGTIGFDASGGVATAAYTTATYNDGNWHHVAMIRRGTSLKLYVDNIERLNLTVTVASYANVYAGRTAAGGNYFLGSMDQIKVWNEALHNTSSSNAVSELFSFPCR